MMLSRRGTLGMIALLGVVERAAQAAPVSAPEPALGPWLHGKTRELTQSETAWTPPDGWWMGEQVPGHVLGFDRTSSEAVLCCTGNVSARRHLPGGEEEFHGILRLASRAELPDRPAPHGWDTLENLR